MASGFYALSGRHSRIVCETILQSISLKAQSQVVETISASTVMQFPIWSDSRLSRVMLNDHSHNATQIPFTWRKKDFCSPFFTWNQTPAFPVFLLKKDSFIPFFTFLFHFHLEKISSIFTLLVEYTRKEQHWMHERNSVHSFFDSFGNFKANAKGKNWLENHTKRTDTTMKSTEMCYKIQSKSIRFHCLLYLPPFLNVSLG